jgi:PST family polysaccharide transporter
VGGASILNLLFGIVRLKIAALVLGAAGIGLIGLLQTLLGAGTAIGGLGLSQSATRQIAAGRASGGEAAARRALFVATSGLAIASALVVWLARRPIASLVLGGAVSPQAVGWMGAGIGLGIAAGSQTALLAGLGRIADVARVSLLTACLSTAAALGFLFVLREQAIIPYLLAVPVASVIAGSLYAMRAPRSPPIQNDRAARAREWRQLFGLGAALMISGVVMNLAQLAVRSLLSHRVGLAELGLFQAAATISVTYLGFVLQAMSADFYPRLSALPVGSPDAERLVNEQTEIALLLGGPIILGMMGLAPWLLGLLYTGEFAGGAGVLRWQMLGDVLRLASWPLGFALIAAGRGRMFVLLELAAFGTLVEATALLLPAFGIQAAGMGFFAMYLVYLPLVLVAVRSRSEFRWSRQVRRDLLVLVALAAGLVFLGQYDGRAAAIAGPAAALLMLAVALRRLAHLAPQSWRARLGQR